MQFFDDKQDVLDVVITPYGESLMAKGLFDPAYYSFFDDDILYDAEWASITTEDQNEIADRIKKNTPRVKQSSVYTGVESSINQINTDIRTNIEDAGLAESNSVVQDTINNPIYNEARLQNYGDKFDFISKPLGRSALTSKKHPSWSVSMLRGEVSSSQNYVQTDRGINNIPQINIDLNYKIYVSTTGDPAIVFNNATAEYSDVLFPLGPEAQQNTIIQDSISPTEFENIVSQIFDDQTYFALSNGKIILDIVEENVDFKKKNFDVQVFLSGSRVNGLNADPVQLLYNRDADNITDDEVEKYLTIRMDREIRDSRVSNLPKITDSRLVADPSVTNVISTREFLLRDLYDPEPDICE